MLAVDWTNADLAGAFVVGAIFGTVVTLRIVRFVTDYFAGVAANHRRRRPRKGGDERPEGED